MKIIISATGNVDDIELSINIKGVEPEPAAAEEQRDSALDALVIPADDRSPHELNAERRRDSYGYEDKQRIGFSVSRHPAAEAALRN